ncbi:unnamed protein product [Durusdinium trenchii]|uniref:Integrase catalytic domain-containing protein n=1 Tax=Durusdinium trenchii TaxID=1381693 RepID=A0ABP0HUI6_9DINO
MLKALTAALSGDKKSIPTWNGSVETLRPWLRQLSYWELDNNVPKTRWGIKLLQSFTDGSAPRKIAETVDLSVVLSEQGYGTILTEIMTKYGPFLEAIGPAAIDHFFYGFERSRQESFSNYIAAKEVALQELEAQLGEKVPPRIAGRVLLRGANLSEQQRENLAIKYNALLTFDQIARALRPLDRPEALVGKVSKTFLMGRSEATEQSEAFHEGEHEDLEEEEELLFEEDEPESDGEGNLTYLVFDPSREYTEEETQYIWAYNSAYRDVRKDLQARRKGRQFFKPKDSAQRNKKGGGKGRFGKTDGHEAVVDTAAEEAVIGSSAMQRLTQALARHGLQPRPASGATVTCSGIGGSAKILGIWDIPIGVCRSNGLIRATEIEDSGSFETPFLLPVSYQELVGAVIDLDRSTFKLRNGRKTMMKRTPSGHRAISILEFGGRWALPEALRAELHLDGENPFVLPLDKKSSRFQQKPGVAVSTIAITMQSRILECIVKEEQQEAKVKKESKKPLLSTQQRVNAWQRMVRMILWMIGNANVEYAANYLMTRHSISELQHEADEREKARLELERQKAQKARMIRRGIGQPLSRSVACKTWHAEPAACAHSDDKLRQRAGRGHFWWTCLDCGSRWERLEAQQDRQINAPSSSSHADEAAGSTVTVINTSSKVAYPKILPAPRYRPDLSDLKLKEEKSPEKSTWPRHVTVREMMMIAANQPPEEPSPMKTPGPIPAGSVKEEPRTPRRRQSSGVRPMQERARQKRSEHSPPPEQFEICSSEEDNPWTNVRKKTMSSLGKGVAAAVTIPLLVFTSIMSSTADSITFLHLFAEFRIVPAARKAGLRASLSMDLTTGYDFTKAADRRRAWKDILEKKPAVILICPPCRTFSPLRFLSSYKRQLRKVQEEEQEGDDLLSFGLDVAEHQIKHGRGFVFEHPWLSRAWKRPRTQYVLEHPDVFCIQCDMCQFGLKIAKGPMKDQLAQKSSGIMSNVPEVLDFVNHRCQKDHKHGKLIGGVAQYAQEYTPAFVQAIVCGIKEALGFKVSSSDRSVPKADNNLRGRKTGKAIGAILHQYAVQVRELEQLVPDEETPAGRTECLTPGSGGSHPGTGHPPLSSSSPSALTSSLTMPSGTSLSPSRSKSTTSMMKMKQAFQKKEVRAWPLASEQGRDLEEALDDEIEAHGAEAAQPRRARPPSQPVEPEEVSAEEAVRAQLRSVTEEPKVRHALRKVEDFRKVSEGEFSLSPSVRREIHKIHRNLGHPGNDLFLRALRHSGVKPSILDWVRNHFSCPACKTLDKPNPQRPGHLLRALEFGQVVGVDLFFIEVEGELLTFLNMLDWGTNFQQVALCQNRTSEEVQKVFLSEWTKHYGPPLLLVSDRGPEFTGQRFQEMISGLGTTIHYTNSQSPWQNSRTEKAGGVFKEKFKAVMHAASATKDEVPMVIAEVVNSRNRFMDRWGFSPMQRVFGKSLRLPASLLSTDALDHELMELAASDPIRRQWQIRELSSQEWLRRQDRAAVQRSVHARTRQTDKKQFMPGEWVYVFRNTPTFRGWAGPGVLLAESPSGTGWWISMRGRLWQVSTEQIRMATPEENLGAELVAELSQDLLQKLQSPGQIAYQDITREDIPNEADFQEEELLRLLRIEEAPQADPSEHHHATEDVDAEMTETTHVEEAPSSHSTYLEIKDFDRDEDLQQLGVRGSFIGATWRYDREQRKRVVLPDPSSTATFWSHRGEASFDYRDQCMSVSKAKSSFGQVEFAKLNDEQKVLFRASRKKELDSLLKNKAIRILSIEESLQFAKDHPEQIIESKFVDRFKPKPVELSTLEAYKRRAIQEGHLEAIELESDQQNPKSRLCAVGWHDPQIHEVKDVKTAFLQSLPTARSRLLACRQPRDETLPGLDSRQLILLLTEIYGLVSGPSWWRRTLLKIATEELGYHVSVYDKCVLTLPAQDASPEALTEGYMVIEVDDIIEAGGKRHEALMKRMEERLNFGKIDELYGTSGTSYAGRHLKQLPDYSFESHMEEFLYTRLEPVKLNRRILKKDAAQVDLSEHEKTQLRGLLASLNWVSREARPDAAAGASVLASTFPSPKVSHLVEANEIVRHLKTCPVTLRIYAIEESKLRHFLVADSAFDTSGQEKSQFGFLLGFTTPDFNQGRSAPMSLMQWRSRRLRRKAASSLLCEAISMSAATAAMERLVAFFESIRYSGFNPRSKQRSEDELLATFGKTKVIAAEVEAFKDPHGVALMDAKALYDSLNSDQSQGGTDDRATLEIAIIKESLAVTQTRPRWIPHNFNPADALTKVQGCHAEPLMRLLRTGHMTLEEESDVLERGKQSQHRMKETEAMQIASRINEALALKRSPEPTYTAPVDTAWYDELGVSPNASTEEIRLRYLEIAENVEEDLAYLLEAGRFAARA